MSTSSPELPQSSNSTDVSQTNTPPEGAKGSEWLGRRLVNRAMGEWEKASWVGKSLIVAAAVTTVFAIIGVSIGSAGAVPILAIAAAAVIGITTSCFIAHDLAKVTKAEQQGEFKDERVKAIIQRKELGSRKTDITQHITNQAVYAVSLLNASQRAPKAGDKLQPKETELFSEYCKNPTLVQLTPDQQARFAKVKELKTASEASMAAIGASTKSVPILMRAERNAIAIKKPPDAETRIQFLDEIQNRQRPPDSNQAYCIKFAPLSKALQLGYSPALFDNSTGSKIQEAGCEELITQWESDEEGVRETLQTLELPENVTTETIEQWLSEVTSRGTN